MSKSLKKKPILGNCVAQSDAFMKRTSAKRIRRANNALLDVGEREHFLLDKELTSEWEGSKDGKHYWPDADPKWLRK